jgi:hypothetical protein
MKGIKGNMECGLIDKDLVGLDETRVSVKNQRLQGPMSK